MFRWRGMAVKVFRMTKDQVRSIPCNIKGFYVWLRAMLEAHQSITLRRHYRRRRAWAWAVGVIRPLIVGAYVRQANATASIAAQMGAYNAALACGLVLSQLTQVGGLDHLSCEPSKFCSDEFCFSPTTTQHPRILAALSLSRTRRPSSAS